MASAFPDSYLSIFRLGGKSADSDKDDGCDNDKLPFRLSSIMEDGRRLASDANPERNTIFFFNFKSNAEETKINEVTHFSYFAPKHHHQYELLQIAIHQINAKYYCILVLLLPMVDVVQ